MKGFTQYITEKIKLTNDRFNSQYHGIEYVDLGLPSGTMWAACNLDANKPWDTGGFYAWGETETKNEFNNNNYKFGEKGAIHNYHMEKYNLGDNLNDLDSHDDVATCKLKGNWHIPTVEQMDELIRLTNPKNICDYKNSHIDGVLFTGKNGNELFIPFCGCMWDKSNKGKGNRCFIWTSSLNQYSGASDDLVYAMCGCVNETLRYFHIDEGNRFSGMQIRPVFKK